MVAVGLLLCGCAASPVAERARPAERVVPVESPEARAAAGASKEAVAADADLASLLRAALAANPKIAAARARWGGSTEMAALARELDDPMLSYAVFPRPIETRLGPQRQRVAVTQALPFPKEWTLRTRSAEAAAGAAGHAFRAVVRDVVTSVREAHAERWYVDRARATARGHMALLEQLLATARREQAKGAVTTTDLLRLTSQRAQLEYDLRTLDELARVVDARVNALIDRATGASLGPVGDLAPPARLPAEDGALVDAAKQHRQELARARAELERAGIELERARWSTAPGIVLGGTWSDIGEAPMPVPDSGDDAWGVTLGVRIPLWGGKNRGRVRKAERDREARAADLAAAEAAVGPMVTQLAFRVRNARRVSELYDATLLPQATAAAATARAWYESGQAGFAHLLEVQSVLYNYHLARDRARADYHQQLAQLEAAVGLPLVELGR